MAEVARRLTFSTANEWIETSSHLGTSFEVPFWYVVEVPELSSVHAVSVCRQVHRLEFDRWYRCSHSDSF